MSARKARWSLVVVLLGLWSALAPAGRADMRFLTQWSAGGTAAAQFRGPEQLAVDPSSGDVYVVDYVNDRVEVFNSSGTYLSQFGGPGSGNGQFSGPEGIAVSPANDDVYVVDAGNDRVEVFNASGQYVSQFGTQGTGNGQFSQPLGLAIDQSGNVYVADDGSRIEKFTGSGTYSSQFSSGESADTRLWLAADTANGDLYAIDAGADGSVNVFNGSGSLLSSINTFSHACSDGPPSQPEGIAVNPSNGNFYIASSELYAGLDEYTSSGDCVWHQSADDNGIAAGYLVRPWGVAIDPSTGDAYVADNGLNRVEKYDVSGNYLLQFGSGGGVQGNFSDPVAVAVDGSSGDVYVGDYETFPWDPTCACDAKDSRVQKFTASGGYITERSDEDVGQTDTISTPWALAVDPTSDDLWVSNLDEPPVWIYSYLNKWTSSFSWQAEVRGVAEPPAGVAVAGNGDVYTADPVNNVVYELSSSGAELAHFGSAGSGDGQFNYPTGVAIDQSNDDVYVVDEGNDRVEKFSSSGTYLLKFGSKGTGDGQFTFATGLYTDVGGIAIDPTTEDVYVVDDNNDRVEVFSSTGQYLSQFGSQGYGHGEFEALSDIAINPQNGDVYLADAGNQRLQIFGNAPLTTSLIYNGATSGEVGQPVTLSATLTDTTMSQPLWGQPITFSVGAETCTGQTDVSGTASCQVTPTDSPSEGPYKITASFAGDSSLAAASDSSKSFTVTPVPTSSSPPSPSSGAPAPNAVARTSLSVSLQRTLGSRSSAPGLGVVRAKLTSAQGVVVGRVVRFTARRVKLCSARTNSRGVASCALGTDQLGLPAELDVLLANSYTASFAGDAVYAPSSASTVAVLADARGKRSVEFARATFTRRGHVAASIGWPRGRGAEKWLLTLRRRLPVGRYTVRVFVHRSRQKLVMSLPFKQPKAKGKSRALLALEALF